MKKKTDVNPVLHETPYGPITLKNSLQLIYSSSIYSVARMIRAEQIDPEKITEAEFINLIESIIRADDIALEYYVNNIDKDMSVIRHCLSIDCFRQAAVLLFTLIEGELNKLIRANLRLRNFEPNKISEALKTTGIEAKLDVILPLMDIHIGDRLRNTITQCRSIRNVVVHNKANPNYIFSDFDKCSDEELAEKKSKNFFIENPIDRIESDMMEFDRNFYRDSSMKAAHILFEKYIDLASIKDEPLFR